MRIKVLLRGLIGLSLGACALLSQARDAVDLQAERALDDPAVAAARPGLQRVSFVDLVRSKAGAVCSQVQADLMRCNAPLRLNGLSGLFIEGNGIQVEFSGVRPNSGGIQLSNARNTVLSGIRIRWAGGGVSDPTPADGQRVQTMGRVVECSGAQKGGALKMDLPLNGEYPIGAVSSWDESTGWPWRSSDDQAADIYLPDRTTALFSNGLSSCIGALNARVGDRVLVRHAIYTNHAIRCSNCRSVTIQHVSVYSAPGMGFVFDEGGRDLILTHNTVGPACAPKCAHPEPSITADASHFAAVEGPIRILGNDFGWQGDDAINVTGLMAPTRIESAATGWVHIVDPMRRRLDLFEADAPVLFFDAGMNPMGDAKVVSVDAAGGRLRLSRLPAQVSGMLLVVPADRVPHDVQVLNNYLHDNRARGILMGGSDALLENNRIERLTMAAILLTVNARNGFEGPGAQRVMIRKNRITDVNRYASKRRFPSAISAGVFLSDEFTGTPGTPIRDITIEDNQFSSLRSSADKPVTFSPGAAGRVR